MSNPASGQPVSGNHVSGKVVVVTGAGSGFGRLVCRKTAALGAKVVCADVNESALKETVAATEAAGGRAVGRVTDVRRLADMQALAQLAVERYGAIDVMVNNAGIMPLAFFADHARAMEAWERCIDVNIKGVLNGIAAVHDQMIAQGRGHVVNLSSIYSNFPVAGAAVYAASKSAVNFFSEALRVESQGKIKVTNVRPTGVPATGLAGAIVNQAAIVGILGQNAPAYLQQMQAFAAGELPAEYSDAENIEYYALAPEHLADQIVYAIDQPWGVSISDITVRASGDRYVL
ncbi:MAG TPA: SDR family oxidoreductase [Pseudomonadales bacterium]|nr:SDR family oxidoreductase [Pseudomonadales bacterium]